VVALKIVIQGLPGRQSWKIVAKLQERGHSVLVGNEINRQSHEYEPDVVLLYGADTTTVRSAHSRFGCPVVALFNYHNPKEVVSLLNSGAEDCLPVSIDAEELETRLNLYHRRYIPEQSEQTVHVGKLEISYHPFVVKKDGLLLSLSPKEKAVLRILAANVGRVVPDRTILWSVWGIDANEFTYLRLVILSLRRKIEDELAHPRYLLKIRKEGYYLNDPGV
jgi:two-component system KDP operon response regulator KdpE